MSLLKQINEKGAVLEWSPIASQANLVALGTKDSSGVGFDDYGGELELHSLDLKDSQHTGTQILGKVRANSRFSSIAWSKMALNNREYPYGLIAGGMIDGFVHIWDAAKLASNDPDPLIASIEQHQGGIRGLQFNPHKESSHLLASGGNDGEVYVLSLERPDEPNVFVPAPPPNNTKHTAEISKVAWNTQVAYILASAAQNGSCFVWDLRQKKAWCELRDPTGGSIADIAWNPDQGLNIITASGDDKNPVIKLWDLRSSTSLPLATLQGHTQGILSASWCPTDPSLILSCGKDNQTILWDLFHLQPIYNLPSYTIPDSNESNVFGSLASTAGQRRYNVSWSPCIPAVIGVCSFDRKVQFYSLSGVKSKLNRAPKWLRKPVGATFGFDRLYHSSNKPSNLRPPVFPYTKVDVKIVSTPVDSKPKPIITTNPTSNSNVVDRKAKLVSSVNTPASVSTLPSGWLELTDPASGRLYYVNQATNQSQWEYPVIPENKPIQSQPQTIPQAKPQGYQPLQSTSSSNLQSNFINQGPTNYPVVNQPVGFVPQPNQSTNSFNPAVNSQFNTFTPVANTFSPTPAVQLNSASAVVNQPAVNTTASVAPVVAPAKKAENVPLPESVHILGGLISQIGGTIVNPADKRQFTAVNQSYNTLCEKISSNEVSADVLQKISLLVQELTNRSYSSANAIQVDLANTVWSQHKEWLKGIKVLIQLASKKT
eukprot:gene17943-23567_t